MFVNIHLRLMINLTETNIIAINLHLNEIKQIVSNVPAPRIVHFAEEIHYTLARLM